MQTLTGYARLAQHGEQGYERAPWWSAKPDKIEDVEPDWSDPNYLRMYKRRNERDCKRAIKLENMLAGIDPRKSNCTQTVYPSMTPAAIKARQWRENRRLARCSTI